MDQKNKSRFETSIALRLVSTQAYSELIGLEAANDPVKGDSPVETVRTLAVQPVETISKGKSKIHLLR